MREVVSGRSAIRQKDIEAEAKKAREYTARLKRRRRRIQGVVMAIEILAIILGVVTLAKQLLIL